MGRLTTGRAFVLVAGVGVIAAALWWRAKGPLRAGVESSAVRPTDGAPGAEVAKANAGQLKAARLGLMALAGAAKASPSGEDDREAPEATPLQQADWLRARGRLLDGLMTEQPRDEAWASSIEAKIKALYAEPQLEGVHLVDVVCREVLCKSEFSYDGPNARRRHIATFQHHFPELPRATYVYPSEPDAHTDLIVYQARTGTSFPRYTLTEYLRDAGGAAHAPN